MSKSVNDLLLFPPHCQPMKHPPVKLHDIIPNGTQDMSGTNILNASTLGNEKTLK